MSFVILVKIKRFERKKRSHVKERELIARAIAGFQCHATHNRSK